MIFLVIAVLLFQLGYATAGSVFLGIAIVRGVAELLDDLS